MKHEQYKLTLKPGQCMDDIVKLIEPIKAGMWADTVEISGFGRHVYVDVYKGQMPKEKAYHIPELPPGSLCIPIGHGIEGLEMLDMVGDSHCFLLAGGNPGTGKSVFINGCIACLAEYPPEWVRFVLIDMKLGIELSQWESLPHTWLHAYDPYKPELKYVLGMLEAEIRKRMKMFADAGVRKISQYHALGYEMPYLMLVIDEYAELKNCTDGGDYEAQIKSLLQIGRAAGLRAILATQRPTTDNISGSVKALTTDRIAFSVSSALNSRVILDCDGAEKIPHDIPGRAIFLTGSKFQNVQVMYYE